MFLLLSSLVLQSATFLVWFSDDDEEPLSSMDVCLVVPKLFTINKIDDFS
jgi:hypothetical protein